MITLSKPVKMVVVFTPGETPRPVKFKVKDNRGDEHTVYIDEILKVVDAVTYIKYSCAAHYEDFVKRFEVAYSKEKQQWDVYKIVL